MDDLGLHNYVFSTPRGKPGNRKSITLAKNGTAGYNIIGMANSEVSSSTDTEPEKRAIFTNMTDDYYFLDNLNLYSKFCEKFNIGVPQMAESLVRAIAVQNKEKLSVLMYDYVNAIPESPPTLNGKQQALTGDNRFCNMVCYKSRLFGVCVFPITDNVTFYFPEFSSLTDRAKESIYTFGNKYLRYCTKKRALAFEFKYEPNKIQPEEPVLLKAALKRKTAPDPVSPVTPKSPRTKRVSAEADQQRQQKSFKRKSY